eukprot:3005546-Rhodomonas_salina.1
MRSRCSRSTRSRILLVGVSSAPVPVLTLVMVAAELRLLSPGRADAEPVRGSGEAQVRSTIASPEIGRARFAKPGAKNAVLLAGF